VSYLSYQHFEEEAQQAILSISNCRGQAYDGASAMAGRKSGVQTRIKEIEPKALFNHCHGHVEASVLSILYRPIKCSCAWRPSSIHRMQTTSC
jgi:hypothetical protein